MFCVSTATLSIKRLFFFKLMLASFSSEREKFKDIKLKILTLLTITTVMFQNSKRRILQGTRVANLSILAPLLATRSSILTLFFSLSDWLLMALSISKRRKERRWWQFVSKDGPQLTMPPTPHTLSRLSFTSSGRQIMRNFQGQKPCRICLDLLASSASESSHQTVRSLYHMERPCAGALAGISLQPCDEPSWTSSLAQVFR